MTITYAVSASVADIHRYPDPTSELVTQALMNTPVAAGETSGAWTHVTLADYTGWMRMDELEEPITPAFCKVGERCGTPLHLVAVITAARTPLYALSEGDETLGEAYLSTVLPLLDTTGQQRVQAALPGERAAWLVRAALDIRRRGTAFPCQPANVITAYARQYLDVPYLWGGTSHQGIDCSGFVQLCYRMGGYVIPRDADQQHDFLDYSVPRAEMQEGDLVFFGSQRITHVALALNQREYIHAEGQNYNYVVINSFNAGDAHYYPRLDEIVWAIKRVIV